MTRVCLLFGGKSGEHEVSCRSAASVARNLDPNRYQVLLVGIDPSGVWHYQQQGRFVREPYGERLEIVPAPTSVSVVPGRGLAVGGAPLDADVVFPVLHGTFGEDGTVQGLLELAELPYVGSGVLGSSLSMDKEKTKQVWKQAGLPVVDFLVLRDSSPVSLRHVSRRFRFPVFVKPARAGSSVGVSRVGSAESLEAAVQEALRFDSKLLVEPAVAAREIECAVLGNRQPETFPPGEIIPAHAFYSYEAKYVDPDGARLEIPAGLPSRVAEEVRSLAVAAFVQVEARGMARVDFFVERKTNRVYLNEINTIPGFTNISMYPKMCEAAGLPYPALLERLIELGVERHEQERRLSFAR
ncbi:MAG: D-alanine--D-alanine ligase [Spirochaetales bacterium]|nr:D-alanine--D-alanine ligase [Spirochaetales bacterium]